MQVHTTTYGAEALSALRRAVAALKAGDPMAPVTVIVPNNIAGIVARRHLAGGLGEGRHGVAALDVTTLARLAERLGSGALAPRRPMTSAVLAAAWRTALATEPGVFAEVGNHPATVQALARAHQELRSVDEAGLTRMAELGGLTAEVVRLHRTVHDSLAKDWYDVANLVGSAAVACRTAILGRAILYLPQDLDPAQAQLVTALSETCTTFDVIHALTGVRNTDAAVTGWMSEPQIETLRNDRGGTKATRVLNVSDSDDEVRCVVRQVTTALATSPAHRVAVLYASAKPYARLLHEQLAAAGIAVNGPGPRSVRERSVARFMLGLLELAEHGLTRIDLFRTLTNASVRDFAGNPIPVSRWERTSRNAGVVRGEDWTIRINRLVEIQQEAIAREQRSEDPRDWLVQRSRQTIETASHLLAFVIRLQAELDSARELSTWRGLTEWTLGLFATLLGRPDSLLHLPADEQYAAAAVTSTLTTLGGLDAVDSMATLTGVREALDLALTSSLPRVGRFGAGVFVGPLSSAVGLELDVVFVMGLSEDVYPGRRHEDPLLPERVRAAAGGQLPSSRDDLDRQQRHLLAAFAAAPTSVASFPRGDLRRSTVRIPSRFLLPTLRALSGDDQLPATEWQRADYGGAMTTAGSFAGELLQTVALSQEQEWRTRQAAVTQLLDDPVVKAGRVMITARAGDFLSRFDGNLAGVDGLPDYATSGQPISPTALESYAVCPHAFFTKRLLGVEPLEQPEDIVVIAPVDIGTLVHEVMDALVRTQELDLPGCGEPWTAEHRSRMTDIAAEGADQLTRQGLTGHPRLWQVERQRILADLHWMLDDDSAWRAREGARVLASELEFGMRGRAPVAIAVPRGRVLMRGSADKVDMRSDGSLIVTDIKTGHPTSFTGITQDEPFVGGTKLQLPVYALAARAHDGASSVPVRAGYWFVRKGRSRKEIELTIDLERRYAETIAVLTDSIACGLFPLKAPEGPDFAWVQCPYCSPDGMGYGELRAGWERKRQDPALDALTGLIDPVPTAPQPGDGSGS